LASTSPLASCLNQPTDDFPTVAAVQGAFYGCSQPAAAIEGLIASHIPKPHIKDVAAVYEKRWWDYRRLAPGHSFYLFAHHYYKASRTAARKMIGEHSRGKTFEKKRALLGPALVEMTAETIWERDQAHVTGIWKSMLVADALGIPYPEFCRMACQVAFDRLWERLPRPTQLYSDNLAVFVMDEWDSLKKSRFVAATHPVFDVASYDGRRMQDDYRAYAIEQITNLDSNRVTALANVLFFRPQLPVDLAKQHFPDQLIERARDLAS
jgi:hypothetical protein